MSEQTKTLKEELLAKYPNGYLNVDPEDFMFFKAFDLPKDFREAVVQKMTDQSAFEWKVTNSFSIYKEPSNGGWKFENKYEEGEIHQGLPYSCGAGTVDYFKICMEDQGTPNGFGAPDGKIDWMDRSLGGVQCVSSIIASLQVFKDICGDSSRFWCANEKFEGKQVGDFKFEQKQLTKDIVAQNGIEKMAECYALLRRGDVVQVYNASNHSRVVKENHVAYLDDNKTVDPEQSYIICIEQTDHFDALRTDGIKTNWYVDHKYTYDNLFKTAYLPVTFAEYETNRAEIPYIALKKIPAVSKGDLDAEIVSDYPMRYLDIRVYDENGGVINTNKLTGWCYDDFTSFKLKEYENGVFDGLEVGKTYRLVVRTGTTHGSANVIDCTFRYEGK